MQTAVYRRRYHRLKLLLVCSTTDTMGPDSSVLAGEDVEGKMWDAYNYFSLCPDVDRMRKLLVRYDLFKQVCYVVALPRRRPYA